MNFTDIRPIPFMLFENDGLLSGRFRFCPISDWFTHDGVLLVAGAKGQHYFCGVVFVRWTIDVDGFYALPDHLSPLNIDGRNVRYIIGTWTEVVEESDTIFVRDCGSQSIVR